MLNLNPEAKKMILALDGGGMRGIIIAVMLAELERASGKLCRDIFDLVAGTSTGAILTAAIALGIPMEQTAAEIYRQKMAQSFPRVSPRLLFDYVAHSTRYLYPIEPFVNALAAYANGMKIGDIQHPIIMITTKDVRTGGMHHICNRGPHAEFFAEYPLAGAVAASSAAPMFFPPVAGALIDGGVGADISPALSAAVMAMEHLGADEGFVDGRVTLISIGTGFAPNPHLDHELAAGNYGLNRWLRYLILNSLDDTALQVADLARTIYGRRLDFRRYNLLLTRENAELLGVDCGRCDPADLTLDSHKPEQVQLMEDLARAYARGIDWQQPNIMPWDTRGGHSRPPLLPVDWSRTPFK